MSTNTTRYYISGGRDNWTPTGAKTLRGAKALCSKAYDTSVGGVMHVGERMGSDDAERIERVAVKDGFSAWRQY